ncbi:MAG: caspase family protein [Clostridiales bacterium]|nr:caspase family protein [Clostridiales bacterium]
MKRTAMLALATLILMSRIGLAGGSAEEFFSEESFGENADVSKEELFAEETFFQDEFADRAVIGEDTTEEAVDAEERSVVYIPLAGGDAEAWQTIAPEDFKAVDAGGKVIFIWKKLEGLPKDAKYFVYEIEGKTGATLQVGRETGKNRLTVSGVREGVHTYFVRAEVVDAKAQRETYGTPSGTASVTVVSTLWAKKPAMRLTQTAQRTVLVEWDTQDTGAERYFLEIARGREKHNYVISPFSGIYIDTDVPAGKSTYKLWAARNDVKGRATSASIRVQSEAWMATPVLRYARQLEDGRVLVGFTHAELAESYALSIGGKKAVIERKDCIVNPENGCYEASAVIEPKTGRQKVTLQPKGTKDGGKSASGLKSNALTVRFLANHLLGVTNLTASAYYQKVTANWENHNSGVTHFVAYLYQADGGAPITKTVEVESNKGSVTFEDVPYSVKPYQCAVRPVAGTSVDSFELQDTANLNPVPVWVFEGVDDLGPLAINCSETTIYLGTDEYFELEVTNLDLDKPETFRFFEYLDWKSLDETVAVVNSYGSVFPVSAGETTIVASILGREARCKVTVNPVTYRALLVGNNYTSFSYLTGPGFDTARMATMLKGLKKTPYQVTVKKDLRGPEFGPAILETFSDADENDVSLFFYSGHGADDPVGALIGFTENQFNIDDSDFVTPGQLRAVLDQVKGRKVILADSCFSGGLIGRGDLAGRSAGGGSVEYAAVTREDLDAVNQAFIDAFRPRPASRDGGEEDNLAADSYYVITAASGEQTSYDRTVFKSWRYIRTFTEWNTFDVGIYLDDGSMSGNPLYGNYFQKDHLYLFDVEKVPNPKQGYEDTIADVYELDRNKTYGTGIYTRSALRGLGWNLSDDLSKIKACPMMADKNLDRRVTFEELYAFIHDDTIDYVGRERQSIQVYYPEIDEEEDRDAMFFAN